MFWSKNKELELHLVRTKSTGLTSPTITPSPSLDFPQTTLPSQCFLQGTDRYGLRESFAGLLGKVKAPEP